MKPANHKENRVDRRLAANQSGKRRSAVVICERDGNSVPVVFRSEGAALGLIEDRIEPGSIVHADEANSWKALHARYEMRRIARGCPCKRARPVRSPLSRDFEKLP